MNRAEHLQWAKDRAYLELDAPGASEGQRCANALTSIVSDLGKHAETRSSVEVISHLGTMEIVNGRLQTVDEMHRWIEGIN